MSYSHFSTNNGDYWLLMGNHLTLSDEPILDRGNMQSLDAIVLEGMGPAVLVDYDIQFRNATRRALEYRIPVFTIDISHPDDTGNYYYAEERTKYAGIAGAILASASISLLAHAKKLTRRRFVGICGLGLASFAAAAAAGFIPARAINSLNEQREEASELDMKAIEIETDIVRTEAVTLRNAVFARKIEECLVPMLMQRLGRKPKIAMIYGSYHAGLRSMILDKEERDEVIEYYSAVIDEKNANPAFERMLNTISEYNADETGNGFIGTEHRRVCF